MASLFKIISHRGNGAEALEEFKQTGSDPSGQPVFAHVVALEPGSVGAGGGGTASSVAINDPTVTTQKAAVSAAGALSTDPIDRAARLLGHVTVDNASIPVTGTFWQATQPVSIAAAVDISDRVARLLGHVTVDNATLAVTQSGGWNVGQSGAPWAQRIQDGVGATLATVTATNALKVDGSAVTQPVSGTFWQATQPVSLAAAVDVSDRAARLIGRARLTDDTNLSTIKAASTAAVATDTALVVAVSPNNTIPENLTQVGGVAVGATAKGTQGTNFVPTQDPKDAGRTAVILYLDSATGITTEALGTMGITKGGVAQTSATAYTVTAGKTFRISGLHTTVKNTSTLASDSRVRVRQGAGSVTASSPIIILNEAGSPAAIAQAAGTDDTVMPDGYEVAGGQTIGISHIESATTCTISVVVIGYEY